VLDWIYSSHVLEDFPDTLAVVDEWLRVLRIGGRLILFLPDEQLYRSYCSSRGSQPNPHHIHADFGPGYLKRILDNRGGVKLIHEAHPVDIYGFELVIEKVG
jgi:predicted SAM-dependent methyltransferase